MTKGNKLSEGVVELTDFAKMDRSALVVRHNKIIESKHSLSLAEQRFLLWIISQIKKEDKTLKTYRVSVKHWEEFCGLKPTDNPYKAAMVLVDKLTTRNVATLDEKQQRYTTRPWFLRATYAYGEGYIEVRLNDDLQDMFLELSREYTAITLEYALLLNSVYAGRIYDLLKQYAKIGERVISLDEMREKFELKDKYSNFKDFRVNVLEVAAREVNAKTDILFDWRPIKEGRKVVAIHFTIESNKPSITLDSPEAQSPSIKRLFERLVGHGVTDAKARNLVADYDSPRVQWHLDAVEKALGEGKEIPSVAGWLVQGIKTDYRNQKSLFQEQQQQEMAERKAERLRQAMVIDHATAIRDEVRTENRRRIRAKIESFTSDEKTNFDRQFVTEMQNGTAADQMAAEAFLKDGLKQPVAAVSYDMKIREHFPEILLDEMTVAQERGVDDDVLKELAKKSV